MSFYNLVVLVVSMEVFAGSIGELMNFDCLGFLVGDRLLCF